MIGTLGDIAFESSTARVMTFSGFSRSGSPKIEEHDVIGRKASLEFVGPGLDEISFTMRLDAFLGVNPSVEIERIIEHRDNGDALSLVIGGKYRGRWAIMSVDETHKNFDGEGRLLVAELSVKLKEATDDSLRSVPAG